MLDDMEHNQNSNTPKDRLDVRKHLGDARTTKISLWCNHCSLRQQRAHSPMHALSVAGRSSLDRKIAQADLRALHAQSSSEDSFCAINSSEMVTRYYSLCSVKSTTARLYSVQLVISERNEFQQDNTGMRRLLLPTLQN